MFTQVGGFLRDYGLKGVVGCVVCGLFAGVVLADCDVFRSMIGFVLGLWPAVDLWVW